MKQQKYRIQDQKGEILQTSRPIYTHAADPLMNKQFPINLQKAHLGRRRRVPNKFVNLQNLIQKHKVSNHVKNFTRKLRLNSIFRSPCQYSVNQKMKGHVDFQTKNEYKYFLTFRQILQNLRQKNGISIGNIGLTIWSIINILQITLMVLIFSFMITFTETKQYPIFFYLRSSSIGLYLADMILNFFVKRYESSKYLQKLAEISQYYLRHGFLIDFLSIMIFPLDIMYDLMQSAQVFMFILAVIKLLNNIDKFQKFEYLIINSAKKQHYYGLVKVFVANFAIGHFLSIILNIMGTLNQQQNWLLKLGISQSQWYVKYVWGYYWGTTIMLTIGFGDISATNFQQALFLIFISIFSCITLAYNISYVGSLISSIGQKQKEKKKKIKMFHKMCKDSFVDNTIQEKISSYIEQQHKIQESYQIQTHDQILKSLPATLQKQYRKQANKKLFVNLGLFSYLPRKSLLKLAELICRKIAHPQEIIVQKGMIQQFMILKSGSLGFICRNRSKLDGIQIQTIQVSKLQRAKILSYNFIKNKVSNYAIKSIGYSVIFYLDRQNLMSSLKQSQMSYQVFCMYKDKDEQILGQLNVHVCPVCTDQYHTKFQCNRLHYVPLKSLIIMKRLSKANKKKQQRHNSFQRNKKIKFQISSHYVLKKSQKNYIQDNFDDDDYNQMQKIQKFYSNFTTQTQSPANNQKTKSMFLNTQSSGFGSHVYQFQKRLSSIAALGFRKSNIINQLIKKNSEKEGLGTKTFSKLRQFLDNNQNDEFWDCQVDVAQNYQYYFRENNPDQLGKIRKSRKNKQKSFNIYR